VSLLIQKSTAAVESFPALIYFFYVYKNVFKHILFYMHDVKVMSEKIGLPIRKLPENTSFSQL
jgi:hypothetical protein